MILFFITQFHSLNKFYFSFTIILHIKQFNQSPAFYVHIASIFLIFNTNPKCNYLLWFYSEFRINIVSIFMSIQLAFIIVVTIEFKCFYHNSIFSSKSGIEDKIRFLNFNLISFAICILQLTLLGNNKFGFANFLKKVWDFQIKIVFVLRVIFLKFCVFIMI